MIKPYIGAKVWYYPAKQDLDGAFCMNGSPGKPLDATVIAVWGDRMVSVLVTDIAGRQYPVLSTTLMQEGDPLPKYADGQVPGRYVKWPEIPSVLGASFQVPATA